MSITQRLGEKAILQEAQTQVQRPRVLCFGRFCDKIPGGIQRHVEHLFIALAGQVDFVHLVPSRDWSNARFTLHGTPVIRKRSVNIDGSLAISPGLPLAALLQHRQHHFDLIHLHFPDPMSHLAALCLPANIPRVISWHSDVVRQKSLLFVYRPFLRRALARAAAIITPTPSHITSSLELSRIEERCTTIPYGFNLKKLAVSSSASKSTEQRLFPGKVIFSLGRHVYYKGFDILIGALRQLSMDVHLVLGGVGPLTEQWKEKARVTGVAERVHFVGYISEQDLPLYYHGCDVFCLPAVSPAEAFGIVQVEAMACGKPVVSTRLGNGVEYVNQDGITGLTVPPNDETALAGALNCLLMDNDMSIRLGRQAQQRVLSEFSLEKMGRRTLELYRTVLAR